MNEINYFEAQKRINQRTAYLYFLFALNLVIAAIVTNYIVIAAEYYSTGEILYDAVRIKDFPIYTTVSGGMAVVVFCVIIVSYLYHVMTRSSGIAVAESAGGFEITGDLEDPLHRVVNEVVDEISLAAVVPTPRIFLLVGSTGINAFAAGKDRDNAVVAVTPDALELERDELQALIAHEMAHIQSDDVKFNWRSIAVLAAFMSLTSFGIYILSKLRHVRSSSNRDMRFVLVVVGFSLLLIAVGYLFYFIGRIIQSKISKQREYHADLNAVIALRRGMPMIALLQKVSGQRKEGTVAAIPIRSECAHFLFTSNTLSFLLDTHPPIKKRIDAIYEYVSDAEMKIYLDRKRIQKERDEQNEQNLNHNDDKRMVQNIGEE